MKIVITEETLKKLILNEAMADVKAAMDSANATYHKLNPNAIKREKVTGNPYNGDFSLKDLFNTQGNGQYSPTDSYAPVNVGNLGNWNVGKSINWIMSQPPSKGLCATYVLRAIAAGGGPVMTCSENGGDSWADSLHYNGILKSHGFILVDSGRLPGNGNYAGNLQPGDVMISDAHVRYKRPGKPDGKRVHAAMWCGNQWVSDFKQNNANVYTRPIDFWIYRYAGGKS